MKTRHILTFLLVIILAIVSGYYPTLAQSDNLTISAAISLKAALEEIKTLYQTEEPKIQISYNFGSSGALQQQIEQGAPVDLFISASTKQMDALQSKNLLVTGARRNLLTNQLVLITPKEDKTINKIEDLTKPNVTKIAIGEPRSVPAGQYAEQVLKYSKILEAVQPKLILAKDVRQVLTYVETDNVNAGLVYFTDAKQSTKVRIAVKISPQAHQPIIYPVAVIKDSKNLQAAKDFLEFLSSERAKTIFKKYGFGT